MQSAKTVPASGALAQEHGDVELERGLRQRLETFLFSQSYLT